MSITEDQVMANAFDVLSAAYESIYNSGPAFEAEFHKGRVAGVEQLLKRLGISQQEVEGLKAEA
ncbi:MAG: hypothetical protein WBI44_00295, partial [Syntrophaceticus sp.]